MSVSPTESLRPRFAVLWDRAIGSGDPARTWARLDAGYGAAGRHYHGWPHVATMLSGFDRAVDETGFDAGRRDAVELAIFFHDAVYDARRSDNEAASAALLVEEAGPAARLGAEAIARLRAMILATADHRPNEDPAARLLCDLDLAILGAPARAYADYAEAVRREYAHLPDPVWRLGRAEVLRRFLARERLYQGATFARLYETAARTNLRDELARLA